MSPLVSICVPIYNVAPFIERCLCSLFEQSYENLEYIFVNDASTDNSIDILNNVLKRYPDRKAKARIIHHDVNRGLAASRRTSIENAQGRYIIPVDSDDYVEHDMAEKLTGQAIDSGADIVTSALLEHFPNGKEIKHSADTFADNVSPFDEIIHDRVHTYLCSKIYRRELFIDGTCFAPEGMNYLEDRITQHKLFYRAKKISYIPDVTYHYMHNSQSITAYKKDFHFECLIRFWQEIDAFLREHRLADTYREHCSFQRVIDKTALMLHTHDMQTRRKYADLYREEENIYMKKLRRGFYIMAHLVHYHAWFLIRIYQIYIDFREKRQNS